MCFGHICWPDRLSKKLKDIGDSADKYKTKNNDYKINHNYIWNNKSIIFLSL